MHRGGKTCSETNAHGWRRHINFYYQAPKTDPRDRPWFLAQPLRRFHRVIFYRNQSVLSVLNISRVGRSTGRSTDRSSGSEGSRSAKRDGFAVGSRIGGIGSSICNQTRFFEIVADRPAHRRVIVRLIIFKICRFSNALFLNLGATGFHCESRARAPRRESSEGCFTEPRLLASHPFCPNSFLGFLCLQVYQLQCTAKCEDEQYNCTLDFNSIYEAFKLVVFLGIRTGTSCYSLKETRMPLTME
jgi:hypothetical protein